MTAGLDLIDVHRLLSQACKAAGSQKAWADQHGMSGAYVNDVLQSRREPGPSILAALGLRKVVQYVARRIPNEIAPAPLRTGTGAMCNPNGTD